MKFDTLIFFMIFPMLRLTALAGQSVVLRRAAGMQSMGIKFPVSLVRERSTFSTRLFSSVSVDSEGTISESSDAGDSSDSVPTDRTKKAEKTFKGLTRMRLRKALLTVPSGVYYFYSQNMKLSNYLSICAVHFRRGHFVANLSDANGSIISQNNCFFSLLSRNINSI